MIVDLELAIDDQPEGGDELPMDMGDDQSEPNNDDMENLSPDGKGYCGNAYSDCIVFCPYICQLLLGHQTRASGCPAAIMPCFWIYIID